MIRIRNGKLLAHNLSFSEGWYLFAEFCSRNLQFGPRWKYRSGYLNQPLKRQTATHAELQREIQLVKEDRFR